MSNKPGSRPPLSGTRVVDWTHVLAGPYASYNLALLGADVIRIERADSPDIIRTMVLDPALSKYELGEAFVMQSSGKRSLAADARDPRVRDALARLIGTADVLLENFRPGKLAELGFDPQALIERFPRLVVCSISGFGQDGPLTKRPAYDHVIQALSGLMAANCDEAGGPMRIGFPLIDYATGMQAAFAVLAALHRRDDDALQGRARRRGEWLDVSMHGAALTLMAPVFASHAVSGITRVANRASAFSGNPLSGTFETAAGQIAFVCNTEAQSRVFLSCMAKAGASDAQVGMLAAQCKARDIEAVHASLRPLMLARSAADWEAFFADFGIPASAVQQPSGAYELVRSDARNWPTIRLEDVDGRAVQVPGLGFLSTEQLTPDLIPPPVRGKHSREILAELGFPGDDIEAMFADRVLVDLSRQNGSAS